MAGIEGQEIVRDDPDALAAFAARWIADRIAESDEESFRIALSGGNTPGPLYSLLGSEQYAELIDWDKVSLFWGDERFVPATDPRSNFGMAHGLLLSRIPIAAQNIHPMPTEGDVDAAARSYEAELKNEYGADALSPGQPLFHLMLLGLGNDGHTCSLFPGSPVLEERARWVAPVQSGAPEPRLTLTYPVIENSARIVFLVTGKEKTGIVSRVRKSDQALPAARIRPQGEVFWFLDAAAAGV